MLDLTRMSSYFDIISDLTIESIRVDTPGLHKEVNKAYWAALEAGCEHPACAVAFADRVLEKFPHLREKIEEAIERWGAVFARGDGASPKDACAQCKYFHFEFCVKEGIFPIPGTMFNACLCTKPEAVLALFIVSERMQVIGAMDVVWLRRPHLIRDEVRIFVYKGKPRLVTWYYYEEPPGDQEHVLYVIKKRYLPFIEEVVSRLSKCGVENVTVDVGLVWGKQRVIELTPFPPVDNERRLVGGVDTILFRDNFYKMLEEAIRKDTVIVALPTTEHATYIDLKTVPH